MYCTLLRSTSSPMHCGCILPENFWNDLHRISVIGELTQCKLAVDSLIIVHYGLIIFQSLHMKLSLTLHLSSAGIKTYSEQYFFMWFKFVHVQCTCCRVCTSTQTNEQPLLRTQHLVLTQISQRFSDRGAVSRDFIDILQIFSVAKQIENGSEIGLAC